MGIGNNIDVSDFSTEEIIQRLKWIRENTNAKDANWNLAAYDDELVRELEFRKIVEDTPYEVK